VDDLIDVIEGNRRYVKCEHASALPNKTGREGCAGEGRGGWHPRDRPAPSVDVFAHLWI
jgi:hypothetical protein